MSKIKTYCRIKPSPHLYEEYETSGDTLQLRVPESLKDCLSLCQGQARVSYGFHFDHIFKPQASQSDVFDVVAKEIIEGFLTGHNGTIFAYGQTGTGKTYTIEGSARQYSERGLESRALSMIYGALQSRKDEDIAIHISYMEIYQEIGYDLLNPAAKNSQSLVTVFPKLTVLEGPGGAGIIRNLSQHLAASEDVAHFLLLQGQANRHVAATTVHDRSSRSHAVFTIYLSARKQDSDVSVRSKLHLVDLAGSERASKTGIEGHQLSEAKSINLSLHHLETVIIALQSETAPSGQLQCSSAGTTRSFSEVSLRSYASAADGMRRNKHIPYRNSQLTLVLRDSLGGNCMTAMIATIALQFENLGETISTCRFASRVACIANTVKRNEELDERIIIRRLRKRVADLETEVSCLRINQDELGSTVDEMSIKLTDEDKIYCGHIINDYLRGLIADPVTEGITSPYKFRECLKILKKMVNDGYGRVTNNASRSVTNVSSGAIFRKQGRDTDILWVHADDHKPQRTQAWTDETITRPIRRSQSFNNKPKIEGTSDPEILPDSERSQSQRYKSPFEHKRDREIKTLNAKVEKMQRDRMEKEQQLIEVKIHLARQEIDVMEKHLRTMLQMTKQQVREQKTNILHLKSTETDAALIEQEVLVEQQLRRRQAKFEKKLRLLDEKRKLIEEDNLNKSEVNLAKERSNSQSPKPDAQLNTRQVFHLLKSEEKRQEVESSRIEEERVSLLDQQLQMKEEATRLKLSQLKELLRQSRAHSAQGRENRDRHTNDVSKQRKVLKHDQQDRFGFDNMDDEQKKPDDMEYPIPDRPFSGRPISQMSDALISEFSDGRSSRFSDRPSSGRQSSLFSERPLSQMSGGSVASVPDSDFYADRKTEKDPTMKWNSPYSRPTTPVNSLPDIELTSVQENVNAPQAVNYEDKFDTILKNPQTGQSLLEVQNLPVTDETNSSDHSQATRFDEKEDKTDNISDEGPITDDSKGRKRWGKDMKPTTDTCSSQYVSGKNRTTFDPQKMDLSKNSFDSALAVMLGSNDYQTKMAREHYDQFARQTSPRDLSRERSPYISPFAASLVSRPPPTLPSRYVSPYAFPVVPRNSSGSKSEEGLQDKKQPKESPFTSKIVQYLQAPDVSPGQQSQQPYESEMKNGSIDELPAYKGILKSRVTALDDNVRESSYMEKLQSQRERVDKIRRARNASIKIQRAWRRHRQTK